MGSIEELLSVTRDLAQLVNSSYEKGERSAHITKIIELLDQREGLLSKIEPPFTEEEDVIGKQIIQFDKEMSKQLNAIFDELKVEMRQFNQHVKMRPKYVRPFQAVSIDGVFIDKRK